MNKIIILLYLLLFQLLWLPITMMLNNTKIVEIGHIVLLIGISSLLTLAVIFYLYLTDNKKLIQLQRQQQALLSLSKPGADNLISSLEHNQNLLSSDFSALKEGQRNLIQAISHELRTPLTRIQFRLETLSLLPSAQTELNGMQKDLAELDQLIEELLTFNQLEQGQQAPNLRSQAIRPLIQEVIDTAKLIYPNQHISSYIEPNEQLELIMEARYIRRALQNLTLNALRYAQSQVNISVKLQDGYYLLVVDDDGPGITEEHRMAVFTPFYRVDNSRTRSTGGYGLGLAIVAKVAKWHQGSVTIDTSPLGGARFSIRWPKPK